MFIKFDFCGRLFSFVLSPGKVINFLLMTNWYCYSSAWNCYIKLLYSIIPRTLISSTPICLINFFNCIFSRCLFCNSASVTIFAMRVLSLWFLYSKNTFTLANVGTMFSLLKSLKFHKFVFKCSNVFTALWTPCPCFFFIKKLDHKMHEQVILLLNDWHYISNWWPIAFQKESLRSIIKWYKR